jgi:15-cis-phytoene synthase
MRTNKYLFQQFIAPLKPVMLTENTPSAKTDEQNCEDLMRGGSKSFFAASRVLPKRIRKPAIALYAFCRLMDDIVDEGDNDITIIQDLQKRLDAIYAGQPYDVAADRALAEVVQKFEVPKILLEALLEGFTWDKQGREYETIEDLYEYAARVAGTVGAMMSLIMGTRHPTALARACELGLAMQLTNIARDVGEDARNGRLYLPRQWMVEEGIEIDAWLSNPQHTPQISRVIERLLNTADMLYQRSQKGITQLPRDCRAAIFGARFVYAEIGRKIESNHLDSVMHRAVVSSNKKKLLMLKALLFAQAKFHRKIDLEPVEQIRYLVEAVPLEGPYAHYTGSFEERMVWVINTLEKAELHRRQRIQWQYESKPI